MQQWLLIKDETPVLNQVYVFLYSLVNRSLAPSDNDSTVIRNLTSKNHDALKKQFNLADDGRPSSAVIVATFLKLRYKLLKFLKNVQKQEVVG